MPRSCCSHSGALLLALLLQASMEVHGWCLESSQCQDLTTESNLLACLRVCQPDLPAGTPAPPGSGPEQPPTESPRRAATSHFRWDRFGGGAGPRREEEAAAAPGGPGPRGEGKRAYSMEHFRWGKPVGKKRRPVKVFPNGAEDESAEAFPPAFKREPARGQPGDPEAGLAGPPTVPPPRRGSPAKDKRYGGFMPAERGRPPLVTLFRNAIARNAHQRGQ